jgi:hypothetical protein
MLKHKIELTLDNYVHLAWMGDKTIENLEGEDWAFPGESNELLHATACTAFSGILRSYLPNRA